MNGSKTHQNVPDTDDHHGFLQDHCKFFSFESENNARSRNFFMDLMKVWLLIVADKVLMARKSPPMPTHLNSEACESKNKAKCSVQENQKLCGKSKHSLLQLSSKRYKDDHGDTIVCNEEYVDVSKVVNCPSGGCNEFPLNIIAFWVILVVKLIAFQVRLTTRFFTVPIWLSYSIFMFPFQTLMGIREHLTKRLLRMWGDLYLSIASSIYTRLRAQKSVLNLATRLVWALFWSIYVWFLLVGLLLIGFVIGSLTMRQVVEEPVQTRETLNFDYTKTSPVAFVAIASGLVSEVSAEAAKHAGARVIPYDHKLHLTVSLTLPESEYNQKLGMFQVRVEFLSANAKATASSSHPCMLRFKSRPMRFIETAFKSAPLMAGFQSEAQTLKIKVTDFTEGHEPTACLKVILEQRAEYQPSAGLPQIYAASIALESELPQLKKIIWCWRRTIFVWVSIMSFLTELVIALILFRPLIMPRGRPNAVGAKDSHQNKISWYNSI